MLLRIVLKVKENTDGGNSLLTFAVSAATDSVGRPKYRTERPCSTGFFFVRPSRDLAGLTWNALQNNSWPFNKNRKYVYM